MDKNWLRRKNEILTKKNLVPWLLLFTLTGQKILLEDPHSSLYKIRIKFFKVQLKITKNKSKSKKNRFLELYLLLFYFNDKNNVL
jgi:hypothetical protein